jgi:hypothetical protein
MKLDLPHVVALLLVAAGVALLAACVTINHEFYHDDTYIALKYVSNWLAGDGITWNPGERVEGYSSFLHLVALAAVTTVGSDLVLAPRVVSFLSLSLLLGLGVWYLVYRERRELSPSQVVLGGIGVLLVAGSFPLTAWALGGLEAPMYALVLTLAVAAFAELLDAPPTRRRAIVASLLFGLAYLARPETGLFVVLSVFWLLSRKSLRRLEPAALFVAPFAGVVGLHVLWRYVYYGDLLPNTFYAKVSGMVDLRVKSGLDYLWDFVQSPPYLVPLILVALVAAVATRCVGRRGLYFLSCFTAFTAYVVWTGGDHMLAFRFFVPVIPLGVLTAYWLLRPAVGKLESVSAVTVLALLLVGACALQPRSPRLNPRSVDPAAFFGKLVGDYIAENWKPGSLIALHTAGSTPFYAPGMTYIDMLGLNDRHIARREVQEARTWWQTRPGHSKGDGDYVLSREPDYIIVGPAMGVGINDPPWFLSDIEMKRNPAFHRDYTLRRTVFDLRRFPDVTKDYPWLSGPYDPFTWYERTAPRKREP